MSDTREAFLEKQINLYSDLIDEMESFRANRKKKEDLENMKVLYNQYVGEYKYLLLKNLKQENLSADKVHSVY